MSRARRPLGLLSGVLAFCTIALAGPAMAAASPQATWQFAPAEAPPAPPETPHPPTAVQLGKVGQISFWSPNRGLLIQEGTATAGCRTTTTAGVPCGLYAYNGASWHLLSTVCGGTDGRIAWAKEDEFWTISDQRPGQVTKTTVNPRDVSLCHFLHGQVVGSYATPFDLPNSYRQMDAAACLSPSNCWFGGVLPPTESGSRGAFHLHWDGQSLSTVYSPEAHAVSSMALADKGTLLESVELNFNSPGDEYGPESIANPFVLHQIDPPGSNIDFHDLFLNDPSCELLEACSPLPNYEGVAPTSLGGFSLSGDYAPSGSNPAPPQVWAIAGRPPRVGAAGAAHPIALRFGQPAASKGKPAPPARWTQVVGVKDKGLREEEEELKGTVAGLAAEPGSPAAWVSIGSRDGEAHVDRLEAHAEGETEAASISRRDVLGEAQHAGRLGGAGPIACPAANDCWLATDQGWLYHLTEVPAQAHEPWRTEVDGVPYPLDTDPSLAGVITFRPLDEGVPQLPPYEPPPDTSLANQLPAPIPPPTPKVEAAATRLPALLVGLRSHVHGDVLELTFKLIASAHVQLIAKRNGHRVAATARRTLTAGKRMLKLRLDPRHWPNKLDLKATPLQPLKPIPAPAGGGGNARPLSSNTVGT